MSEAMTGSTIFQTVTRLNIELMRLIYFCRIAIKAKTIFCPAHALMPALVPQLMTNIWGMLPHLPALAGGFPAPLLPG